MNQLLLPLLIVSILLFISIVALIFAFKTGDEATKEIKELQDANKSLRDELYNRIMKDKNENN